MTKANWHPHNLTDLIRTELRMAADGTVRMRSSREQDASFAAFQARGLFSSLPSPFHACVPTTRTISVALHR